MKYFVLQGQEKIGPIEFEEIKQLFDENKISIEDFVLIEESGEKLSVGSILALPVNNQGHAIPHDLIPPFEAYKGQDPFVFVSYAHKDSQLVYPEINALHGKGYKIWYDEGIGASNEWPEEIAKAVISCAVFIVFVTENSVSSKNCRNEINLALDEDKPFLAIHLKETSLQPGLRLRMGDLQAIFRYRLTRDQYEGKLTESLDQLLANFSVEKTEVHTSISHNKSKSITKKTPHRNPRKKQKTLTYLTLSFASVMIALIAISFWTDGSIREQKKFNKFQNQEHLETKINKIIDSKSKKNQTKSAYATLRPEMGRLLQQQLIASYEFDEEKGRVINDSSGYGKNGELYGIDGNETTWVSGVIGGSINLDGINDYIRIPVTLDVKYSVCFWIRTKDHKGTSDSANWNLPVGIFTGQPNTHAAFLARGKLLFWSSGHGYRKTSAMHVNNGEWLHVVCSRDDQSHMKKGHFHLYLNGLLDSRQSVAYTRANSGPFLFLGRNFNGSKFYKGQLDDLRFYGRQINGNEVKALYGLGKKSFN